MEELEKQMVEHIHAIQGIKKQIKALTHITPDEKKAKYNAYHRMYRLEHPEKNKIACSKNYEKNKAKRLEYQIRYRAKMKGGDLK